MSVICAHFYPKCDIPTAGEIIHQTSQDALTMLTYPAGETLRLALKR